MFEEGAWSDAEGGGAADPRASSPPAPARPPPARRRLLATLRRLQAAASAAPRSRSPSPARPHHHDASEPEAAPRPPRKRRARARQVEGEAPGDGAAEGAGVQAGSAPETPPVRPLSRRQWRNRQKNRRRQKNKFKESPGSPPPPEEGPPPGPADCMRLRLEQRLDSARFRYINQQLYTRPSREAARLFRDDPEAFAVYHRGFSQQLARWPENPVQRFVRYLRSRPASWVVADFGCGDCTLARGIRNKVHCFDVAALDPRVTVCDMAQVPLEAASVDVAVFCLALMGTNLCEILEEANRVLRVGGILLVAEVASRFADLRAFLGALSRLGFQLVSKDVSGSHFYALELRKAGPSRGPGGAGTGKTPAGLALLPCLYKRR